MPELPDVEGFRRVLDEHAAGHRIDHVSVFDAGILRGVSVRTLRSVLTGRRLGRTRRHGKWLIAPVSGEPGEAVLIHFGMTGSLRWTEPGAERDRHDRMILGYGDGELRYRDMRKLQGVRLAKRPGDVDRTLADLGPDATQLSRSQLRELLGGMRRQIKPALIDQSVTAGLGNLLADEILWRARIHPARSTADLDADDVRRLHERMRTVLRRSITAGRVPPRKSWLTGRRDEPSGSCPRCGTTLRHGRFGGRGTTWCPHCQPA